MLNASFCLDNHSLSLCLSLIPALQTHIHTHIWLAALLKMYIWHELSWFVCYISLCTAFVKSRCVKHSNATVLSVRNTTIIEYDVFYIKAFIVFGLCQKVYATGAFNAMMPQLFHSLQFYLLIKCTLWYNLQSVTLNLKQDQYVFSGYEISIDSY